MPTAAAYKPTLDLAKFEELLVYIAERSADDPAFGKTKLNKILYYIDFNAYGQLGQPVTGATYQHRAYGPVPLEINRARNRAVSSGAVGVDRALSFGYRQERLIARRSADRTVFTQAELDVIDVVVDWLRPLNAVQVSDLSHDEMGYRATSEYEVIPYESVYISRRKPSNADISRAQAVWAYMHGEASRPSELAAVAD
jgi:hypothetical protein